MNNDHLPEGTLLDERYQIREVLGEGGFGITYAAWNQRIRRKVAVKELFWREHVYRDRIHRCFLCPGKKTGRIMKR